MSIVTPEQQEQVNECAAEYVKLVHERNDRLEKLIIEAQMWLSLGEYSRAQSTLYQALNS